MITRIHTGRGLYGALKYNFTKVENKCATVLYAPNCFTHKIGEENYSEFSMGEAMASFRVNLERNNRIEKPVFTVSINPHPADLNRLTDVDYVKIAKDYMEGMGYANQPYVVVKHNDIERTHIHIVSIRVDSKGNKISDRFEKVRTSILRKEIEEKYDLTKAEKVNRKECIENTNKFIQNHKVTTTSAIEYAASPNEVSYGNKELLNKIKDVLLFCKDYNTTNFVDYNKVLRNFGVQCEVTTGTTANGIDFGGVFYYAIDESGKQCSKAFKGSLFGQQFAYNDLLSKFEKTKKYVETNKNSDYIKKQKEFIAREISYILKPFNKISPESFRSKLAEKGITVDINYSVKGDIFGISFIDNISGNLYKGSDLGKDFTAKELTQNFAYSDISIKDLFEVQKSLTTYYNTLRKTAKDFYYESSLIEALPQLREELKVAAAEKLPNLSTGAVESGVEQFISYKQGKLAEQNEKELGYFKSKTTTLVSVASTLNPQKQSEFLYRCGVGVSHFGTNVKLYSIHKNTYSFPSEQPIHFSPVTATVPMFSKTERQVIEALATNDWSKVNLAYLPIKSPLFNYLNKEQCDIVNRQKTVATVNEIALFARSQKEPMSILDTVNLLHKKGWNIIPLKKADGKMEYVVGRYNQPAELFVKLSDSWSKNLDSVNYQELYPVYRGKVINGNTGKTNLKYSVLVNLYNINSKDEEKSVKSIVDFVTKVNPTLALKLEQAYSKTKKLDSLIEIMEEQIDNLQEEQQFRNKNTFHL